MRVYGKKGEITYLPLILVGIFVLLVYGCTYSSSCPKEIIPERFGLGPCQELLPVFYSPDEVHYSECEKTQSKWLDGSQVYSQFGDKFPCETGHSKGENLNYTYCKLLYSNTPVINGVVQDKVTYAIIVVVDPQDCNEEGCKVVSANCKKNSLYS